MKRGQSTGMLLSTLATSRSTIVMPSSCRRLRLPAESSIRLTLACASASITSTFLANLAESVSAIACTSVDLPTPPFAFITAIELRIAVLAFAAGYHARAPGAFGQDGYNGRPCQATPQSRNSRVRACCPPILGAEMDAILTVASGRRPAQAPDGHRHARRWHGAPRGDQRPPCGLRLARRW